MQASEAECIQGNAFRTHSLRSVSMQKCIFQVLWFKAPCMHSVHVHAIQSSVEWQDSRRGREGARCWLRRLRGAVLCKVQGVQCG
jgi:hypothetical protein